MTGQQAMTKAELLADTQRAWEALNFAIECMTETQLTELRDDHGWSVKDHIIHLTAWERSVVFLLQGKPQYEGLGVDKALFLQGGDDAVNAIIQKQRRDMPLSEAHAEFRNTHKQLLALLAPLTDDDLNQRYAHYLPGEVGDGEGPIVMNVIRGNTASHFAEHLAWMQALANKGEQTA